MKTKKFNYEKYGDRLIQLMDGKSENDEVFAILQKLQLHTDNVPRRVDQWRRIYYTARKKAGLVPDTNEPQSSVKILDRIERCGFDCSAESGCPAFNVNSKCHSRIDQLEDEYAIPIETTNEYLASRIAEVNVKIDAIMRMKLSDTNCINYLEEVDGCHDDGCWAHWLQFVSNGKVGGNENEK
jgi:hypothetical protein